MKQMKQKLFFMAALIMLLSACALILAFNVTLNQYIEQEAKKIIHEVQKSYVMDYPTEVEENISFSNSDAVSESDESQIEEDLYLSPVQAEMLLLTKDYTVSDEYGYGMLFSDKEKRIVEYCRQHPNLNGEIRLAQIANQEFYLSQSSMSDWGDQIEILLVYVNVTPLKNFSSRVNLVFFVVLLLCGAISGYAGLRMGVRIENSQEKMKRFFENASHELKTPLMSIQGYAEGLLTGVIKDQNKASQIILSESDKINALVEEILFISKLESGRMTFRRDCFSMNEMLFDCLHTIEAAAIRKELALRIDIPEEPLIIVGDELQLGKAVGNILSNALRYAVSEISVHCACRKDSTGVLLKLENDGPSIRDADLPYLFDRFYTGDRGHTGIGLSLAKEIVEQHGGTLSVANVENGVQFKLLLPTKK